MMKHIDTLFPMPNEVLTCLVDRHNMTLGKAYRISAVFYEFQTAFKIMVFNDEGNQEWFPLYYFNYLDD